MKSKSIHIPEAMKEQSKNNCNLGQKLLGYDQFGQSVSMNLDQGQGSLPSKMGTVSSFLLFVILIAYTYYKFNIMLEKKAVDILSAVKQDYFQEDYTFGSKQGFNIAVAVFDPFDPSSYRQLDRSYGQVRF